MVGGPPGRAWVPRSPPRASSTRQRYLTRAFHTFVVNRFFRTCVGFAPETRRCDADQVARTAGSVNTIRVPTSPERRPGGDAASVALDDLLADGQADPVAVVLLGVVGPVEGLEDLVALGGRDADALVRDGDLDPVAHLPAGDRTRGTAPGATYLTALAIRLSSSWRTSAASA